MKGYQQGRMDAWERIDAIKRRLGLAGFFNEQKIKRYPKGHPKAGEFMSKPKDEKRTNSKTKTFYLDFSPVRTEIDGHSFAMHFSNLGNHVGIDFLAKGSFEMSDDLPAKTKKKAAIWWRRTAVDTLKMMPDGIPLKAVAYNGDGRGSARIKFYEALGFSVRGYKATGVTKGGKISPLSLIGEMRIGKTVELREMKKGSKAATTANIDLDSPIDPQREERLQLERAETDRLNAEFMAGIERNSKVTPKSALYLLGRSAKNKKRGL